LLTKNGRAASPPVPTSTGEDELRDWARQHLERVRRLKLHVAAFVLGLVVLTPVWRGSARPYVRLDGEQARRRAAYASARPICIPTTTAATPAPTLPAA